MDGVLADFDRGYEEVFGYRPSKFDDSVDWDAVRRQPKFYENLPPMMDMPLLWEWSAEYRPVILTGVPDSVPEAYAEKRAWVLRNLGPGVPVIGCRSREKSLHMQAGDILVDDWEKYRHLWIGRGGLWITHRNATDTIHELARFRDAGVL
jgi:hypothetical protein